MGSKVEIDIKGIDGSGRRPYHQQTGNIIENIKDIFDRFDDPKKVQIICDLAKAPPFLQITIHNNIRKGLDANQLNKVDFLFD